MEQTTSKRKIVAIVGGGFAGLNLARQLFRNKFYEVILIDRNNYNYFTPLVYQVATGFLEPSSISYPFRMLFKGQGIKYRMASLLSVDTAQNKVFLSDKGEIVYDYLVFAAGSKPNFFGNESVRRNAFPLKGVDDALLLRDEFIRTLEKASIEKDAAERRKLLTIVIAGGGPTGVEVAGMLAEMKRYIVGKDYPELTNASMEIHVIDGASHLLQHMSEKTHDEAYRTLTQSGVHVKLNTRVLVYENGRAELSDGETIEAKTLVWAAGVVANTFSGLSEECLGKGRRMITDAYSRVRGYENIFAIGDMSIQSTDNNYPHGHPQLAQPAIQQGKTLGQNLLRLGKGQPMKPFKYFDRGDMAIIGRRFAVADLFKHKLHLHGILGLLGWLFIHLVSLVNYNNKIKTMYNWAVAYLTKNQALRMIFRSKKFEK